MAQPSARSWAETLEIGRRGEAVLDAVFGPEFIIVKATRDHERQGVDRFFVHRRDGRLIHRVDFKTDEAAGRTGNLALEHVSVVRHGRRAVDGWVHATIADLIIAFVPALDRAFVLAVPALRAAWPDILRCFPPRLAATSDRGGYQTLVCCVPIPWLREARLVVREVDAVNAQLRLPLTVAAPRPRARRPPPIDW
ncbi:MAG: hypothetical protein FJ027_05095 [Candidatus Rokubacteria bacterium]|nr:hypothetical protein [Candidatus Rokubacteria bacterium]